MLIKVYRNNKIDIKATAKIKLGYLYNTNVKPVLHKVDGWFVNH